MNDDYDVVLDTLQLKYDALWEITKRNHNADMFNIMDQIRHEQMDELKQAMKLWRKNEPN